MSEIKMSYVDSVPPICGGKGIKHDWITLIDELVHSGRYAVRLECEDVKKAVRVVTAMSCTVKSKAFDVLIARRGRDVYIVNKAMAKKK